MKERPRGCDRRATLPPCESLGTIKRIDCGVGGGRADNNGNSNCVTYLPHMDVLLPNCFHVRERTTSIAMALLQIEDVQGGSRLDEDTVLGQRTMALMVALIGRNGGHNHAVIVCGVVLCPGVPCEVPCPGMYFTV